MHLASKCFVCDRRLFKYQCCANTVVQLAEGKPILEETLPGKAIAYQRDISAVELTKQVSDRISVEKYIEDQKKYRSAEMDAMMEEKYCSIPSVSKVFRVGVPFQELLKIIEQENPSLVVMGTRGRSNITGAFLGSTAE